MTARTVNRYPPRWHWHWLPTRARSTAIELSLGLESRLSIGVVSDINSNGLLAAVKALAERYPLLDIEVLTAPQDDVLHMLHQQRVSLCLAFGELVVNSQEHFHYVGSESLTAPLLEQGRVIRLKFKNTKNELRLPMHLIWLKHQPQQKAARELLALMMQGNA